MTDSPEQAKSTEAIMPECFVIMPISDPEGYEQGHFQKVYEDIFVPACGSAGLKAIRADESRECHMIQLLILRKLIEAPMALCDLSARNPNVMYELGVRQAFGKPVVLANEKGASRIFDVASLRCVDYDKEMPFRAVSDDRFNLTAALKATFDAHRAGKGESSMLKLLALSQPATLPKVDAADMLQTVLAEIRELHARSPDSAKAGMARTFSLLIAAGEDVRPAVIGAVAKALGVNAVVHRNMEGGQILVKIDPFFKGRLNELLAAVQAAGGKLSNVDWGT